MNKWLQLNKDQQKIVKTDGIENIWNPENPLKDDAFNKLKPRIRLQFQLNYLC
jgi:hypothetical protein